MKKISKTILLVGFIFILAGCRNQVNRDFFNRFVELQEHDHTHAEVQVSDIGLTDSAENNFLQSILQSALSEVSYAVDVQKDKDEPTNMLLQLGLQVGENSFPFMDMTIANEQALLDVNQFLNLQLLTGTAINLDSTAWEQLQADHTNKFVALENEEAEEELSARDLRKMFTAVRKGFLDVDPELFTETEEEISVTLGKEELALIFAPLMVEENQETADFWNEQSTIAVTLTIGLEEPLFTAEVSLDDVEMGVVSTLGMDVAMEFSDNEQSVPVPAEADIVPQGMLQNLLTPIEAGEASSTGYTEPIFTEVLTRVGTEKETMNRVEGREILNAYQTLLTKEQHTTLQETIDLPSLPTQTEYQPNEYVTEGPHSSIGMGGHRFEALIESIVKYRHNQTKESAQRTLDQYYHLLTEEEYQQLEEALDIDTLPE